MDEVPVTHCLKQIEMHLSEMMNSVTSLAKKCQLRNILDLLHTKNALMLKDFLHQYERIPFHTYMYNQTIVLIQ